MKKAYKTIMSVLTVMTVAAGAVNTAPLSSDRYSVAAVAESEVVRGQFEGGASYRFIPGTGALILEGEGTFTAAEFEKTAEAYGAKFVVLDRKVKLPANTAVLPYNEWLYSVTQKGVAYPVCAYAGSPSWIKYQEMINYLAADAAARGEEKSRKDFMDEFVLTTLSDVIDTDALMYLPYDIVITIKTEEELLEYLRAYKVEETQPVTEETTETQATEETLHTEETVLGKNDEIQETTETKEAIRGDVNGDGKVTVRDAMVIAKAFKCGEGDTLPKNADFNGDGIISVRDAATIAKYLKIKSYGTLQGDADMSGDIGIGDIVAISKYTISSVVYPLKGNSAFANADINGDCVVDSRDISLLIEMFWGNV